MVPCDVVFDAHCKCICWQAALPPIVFLLTYFQSSLSYLSSDIFLPYVEEGPIHDHLTSSYEWSILKIALLEMLLENTNFIFFMVGLK